jgi:hypothetical protein
MLQLLAFNWLITLVIYLCVQTNTQRLAVLASGYSLLSSDSISSQRASIASYD